MRISLSGLVQSARRVAAALAIAAIGGAAAAQPLAEFGPTVFAVPSIAHRITVPLRQILQHPDENLTAWRGFSAHPRMTALQRSMISGRLAAAGGSATIPYWTAPITSPLDGNQYTMSMVGTSPYTTTSSTNITYVPIILKVTVGRYSYDPTKPACNDTTPVSTRFYNSPIFTPVPFTSNGVNVTGSVGGSAQLINAFQRANFWNNIAGTGYGVTLSPSTSTPIVVTKSLPGYNYTLTCSNGRTIHLASIDINTFDAALQQVAQQYASPTQLPVILTYNVVETQSGQCCVLGYHNAIATGSGVLTYATGAYVDSGIFSGTDDVSVWSHELGEWMDDPFVQTSGVAGGGNDDVTPLWGNIGQTSGCQNNLEVGDPLSGTEYAISLGGFTYHYQDLAFHDWFYRTNSTSTGGKYSFVGNFTSTQPLC